MLGGDMCMFFFKNLLKKAPQKKTQPQFLSLKKAWLPPPPLFFLIGSWLFPHEIYALVEECVGISHPPPFKFLFKALGNQRGHGAGGCLTPPAPP